VRSIETCSTCGETGNTYKILIKVSGSHDGECEDDSLLEYDAVYCRRSRLTFQRCVLSSIIALMMETEHTSEMSIYFYETTQRHIPEDCHLQSVDW
jgi:hypothetical protein